MTAKTSADLLTLAPGTSFVGTFRVHSIDVTLAQEQCPRLWLQMGDATGDIDARLVLDRHSASLNRGYYHVAGVIQRLKNGTAYADLTQVDLATDDDLLGGPALLPLRFCPPPACAALKGWISLHQSLPTALQRFTAALTLDRDRDLALLRDAFSAPGYQGPGGRLLLAHHRQAALFYCAAVTRPPKELTDIRVTRLGCVLHALNLVASSFRSPHARTPMGSDRGKFAGALARLQSEDPRAAQWLVSLFGDLDRPADWPWAANYPGAGWIHALHQNAKPMAGASLPVASDVPRLTGPQSASVSSLLSGTDGGRPARNQPQPRRTPNPPGEDQDPPASLEFRRLTLVKSDPA